MIQKSINTRYTFVYSKKRKMARKTHKKKETRIHPILFIIIGTISLSQSYALLHMTHQRSEYIQDYNNINNKLNQDLQYCIQQPCLQPYAQIRYKNSYMNTTAIHITEGERLATILNTFAEAHKYNSSYDCTNYSQDFHTVMTLLGYQTQIIAGYPLNDTYGHAWNTLIIQIEPQTGKIVNYNQQYPLTITSDTFEVLK